MWLLVGAEQPYKGYEGVEQFVEIPPGAGPASIGRRLAGSGVIRDQLSFRVALARSGQARRLQAGEYRFDRPMTTREVIDKIARGDVFLRPITFPEGLTIRQMAEIYERDGGGSKAEFLRAARNASLDPRHRSGARRISRATCFPTRIRCRARRPPDQLVERMVTAFRDVMTPELVQRAAARGMSVRAADDAGLAGREGNGETGRAPDRGRRLHQPAEDRHGDAVRSDRDLRTGARRQIRRQPHAREPAVRLALQHLPLCRSAAGANRRAGPGVDRGRGLTG